MADPEQLSILKSGVDEWNAWKREHPNEPADLSGADLSHADLGGTILIWARLATQT